MLQALTLPKSCIVMFIMHILVAAVSPGCKGSEELGSEAVGFSVSSNEVDGIPLLPFVRL